jgi:hypothetical protein
MNLLFYTGWEREKKRCADIGIIIAVQSTTMRRDNRTADRQTHAHAGFLGGKKGREQTGPRLVADSMPTITNIDSDAVI